MTQQSWDTTVDLLVIGSGAGGMTSALTAAARGMSALVVEKAAVYGGNTALSGGGIWIPNNPVLQQAGIVDEEAAIVDYLESIVGGTVPAERISAYAHYGPEVIRFLQQQSAHMKFLWARGYSDYHPENPGGRPEGRSIEPCPIDLRQLGADAGTLRQSDLAVPGGLWLTQREFRDLTLFTRTWQGRRMLAVAAWRMLDTLVSRRRVTTLGTALIARLRLALREAGVPLWLHSPLGQLLTDSSGRVLGAQLDRDDGPHTIRATRGVVLAAGGFEHNPAMRAHHLPAGGRANRSAGAPSNTGDGIRAGQAVGADLALMDDAWWMPTFRRPDGASVCLVSERCIPRSVILNHRGERFTNEAAPYVTFVHTELAGAHDPIWFLMDGTAKHRYQFGGIMPGQPFPADWYRAGTVYKARTIPALCRAIGLPAEAVVASLARFNDLARRGVDEDFGRGASAYDRYYGDDSLDNPVLDVITEAPYYAVRVEPGDLGTKGGLRCDASSRVLRADNSAIDGLYATGNCSAAVMGTDYAGPGATIGPAMVFGWIAAHAAQTPDGAFPHDEVVEREPSDATS